MNNLGKIIEGLFKSFQKEHILGIYSSFERANEEVDRIFHTIDAQAEPVTYAMSEGDE